MTSNVTLFYVRANSDSKLTGFASEPEMPESTSDPPLSVLSNNTSASSNNNNNNNKSPSLDGPRKSNEKTISGVFAYTNGTDVDTGLPDHRLEQLRGAKYSNQATPKSTGTPNGTTLMLNSNAKAGTGLTNGTPRSRAHSKAGSTHSMGSFVDRHNEKNGAGASSQIDRSSLDGPSKSSNSVHAGEAVKGVLKNGEGSEQKREKPSLTRGQSETAAQMQSDVSKANASSNAESSRLEVPGSSSTRQTGSVHRFSSPPAMSHTPSAVNDSTPRHSLSPEPPKLTQRHTLQIPRASVSASRASRDFSFSHTDEVLSASGRFSPTRDNEPSTPRHRRPSLGLVRRTTRSMVSDAHFDEVPPDEDAARWTEMIKQKRASRRKRREEEDDERVIVGKKVEEGHVNWVIAYNMLTGIRFTVSRTNAKIDRDLIDADFDAKHKFSFDVTGNELTPSAKYDFKFKDYSPWVFRHLRAIFGLDPADYLMSLTSKYILSELGSPGKSGSFFYFSRDYKYIIKTIHHAEHKLLRRILREYYAHVRDNPNTLISQFYGLHRVKIPYGRKIHFVVMNNLFPPHRDIHQTFDLKGSTIGRDFKEEDLDSNPRATLKDLNWLRRDLHLEFQHQIKKMFLDQIQKDVALLQKLKIMDYSLLVGMHDLEKGNEENVRETTLQVFQPGGERDEEDELKGAPLLRTPSRLENARKARELRQTLKKEKPTPMSLVTAKMPDQMQSTDERQFRIFYSDDGGIRATHEDGTGGEMVYYLGIIDCLTHYGFVKRIEHFWKGLSSPSTQISPIPPYNYGERFINFITGVTMTKEEAERRRTTEETRESVDAHNLVHHHHIPTPIHTSFDGASSAARDSAEHDSASPRSPNAVEKTMRKAHKQAEKEANEKGRLSEDEVPDRELKTVNIPAQDSDRHHEGGAAGRNSTTLPVVQEVGEGSSDVSSRRSERAASQSRDLEPTTKSDDASKRTSDTKQVSTENPDDQHGSETTQLRTPATEYFTPISPNFSRPNPHSPLNHPMQAPPETQQQNREKPPRLGSGLIPHLMPMFSSPDALDPEKSVIDADGEVVDGVEDLPGLGVGDGRNTVR